MSHASRPRAQLAAATHPCSPRACVFSSAMARATCSLVGASAGGWAGPAWQPQSGAEAAQSGRRGFKWRSLRHFPHAFPVQLPSPPAPRLQKQGEAQREALTAPALLHPRLGAAHQHARHREQQRVLRPLPQLLGHRRQLLGRGPGCGGNARGVHQRGRRREAAAGGRGQATVRQHASSTTADPHLCPRLVTRKCVAEQAAHALPASEVGGRLGRGGSLQAAAAAAASDGAAQAWQTAGGGVWSCQSSLRCAGAGLESGGGGAAPVTRRWTSRPLLRGDQQVPDAN